MILVPSIPFVSKRFANRLLLFFCVGMLIPAAGHAQQATAAPVTASRFAAGTYVYRGPAIWQQVDGTILHGTVTLNIFLLPDADGSPTIATEASFSFDVLGNNTDITYLFQGTLDTDRFASLQASGIGGAPMDEAVPAFNLGSLPLRLNKSLTVASGGVLAADGTQLTFRATFKKLLAQ